MNVTKLAKLLPVLGLASLVSPPALAQTSSGTMAPAASGTMSPVPKAKAKSNHSALPANEQFSTKAAATSHCPGGDVEWTTLSHSKAYHTGSSKYFAKTKHGAYACKSDLDAAGFHQAKN